MSLQTALFGPARTAGEFFKTKSEAESRKRELRDAGYRNCRVSSYHDHTRGDGVKVYMHVVRCDSKVSA
jgi:hypothetical protein